jgi:hypothetical protein
MGFSNRVRFKSVIKESQSKCFAVFGKFVSRTAEKSPCPCRYFAALLEAEGQHPRCCSLTLFFHRQNPAPEGKPFKR